ncbi:hypothetical protein O1R50_19325 [Glycomyces luteolus]|uniref:Uncharacterized protein n=1 Tax=Glycomyces luteolus TaxID=2670330 RepID=A0A9X3PAF4_9ACTN|nr:hypothetical protein [Glycomyces luteolus]MDA1361788.1 hypothetical protein [Glycomyces luteolus]
MAVRPREHRRGRDAELHAEPFSGKKIPDFSWAGYRDGESPIPDVAEVPLRATDVPIVKTIGPLIGQDNTAHLQAALDEVGSMPMQENGFRGALLLNPGLYEVAKTVFMQRSGVVLRGSSRSADPGVGTIIRSTATAGAEDGGVECPLWVGGKAGGWEADVKDPVTGMPIPVKDTATNVTSDRVPAGSRRLTLPAPSTA